MSRSIEHRLENAAKEGCNALIQSMVDFAGSGALIGSPMGCAGSAVGAVAGAKVGLAVGVFAGIGKAAEELFRRG